MVVIKPLTPVFTVIGIFSAVFGYIRAYMGQQIGLVYLNLTVFMSVIAMVSVIAVATISYRYGQRYVLTKISGFVLIALAYLTEVLGNLVGTAIYQIQMPEYPVLQFMLLEIVSSYGYIYIVLIGTLAANYVRELDKAKDLKRTLTSN